MGERRVPAQTDCFELSPQFCKGEVRKGPKVNLRHAARGEILAYTFGPIGL